MTAGMAANRPMAVANSASAMPGATTASDGVVGAGDGGEAAHDAPDGAEQADERRDRADRGEDVEAVAEAVELGGDGGVHPAGEPLAGAGAVDRRGRRVERRHSSMPAASTAAIGSFSVAAPGVEGVDVVGRPEVALEPLGLRG